MASATITRDGPRGHVRAIHLAGAASLLVGVASSWAQEPYAGPALPFCHVYPPGTAPAIGPSNCMPVPAAVWEPTAPRPDVVTQGAQPRASAAPPQSPASVAAPDTTSAQRPVVQSPLTSAAAKAASPAPPSGEAHVDKPPAPDAPISLRTAGAITLDQIADLLGPASRRTVSFSLSPADDYVRTDQTHRVRLTWSGPIQGLADQLAEIYGLDVAIDDTAIRFSSRPRSLASGASTTRTP